MNYPSLYLAVLEIAKKQFGADLGNREFLLKEIVGGELKTPDRVESETPNPQRKGKVLLNE